MIRRALVVCTANVCRSPVAAALLARRLDGLIDDDGDTWSVASAGTHDIDVDIDPHTVASAAAIGLDLGTHRRRRVDRAILATDGADLVIVMTRQQLRTVVGIDPAIWSRAFTLKELSRRSIASGPRIDGEDVAGWVRRTAGDRRAATMMAPDPGDDVADPFGRPRREHDAMVAELVQHVDAVVAQGPWLRRRDHEERRSPWAPATR